MLLSIVSITGFFSILEAPNSGTYLGETRGSRLCGQNLFKDARHFHQQNAERACAKFWPTSSKLSSNTMTIEIIALTESHFEVLRQVLDSVAREKRYLVFLQAPPAEQAYAFYRNIVDNDLCMRLVKLDGQVVGWCDVLPTHGGARSHVGTFGMGLISSARHQRLGRLLAERTLEAAWQKGYTRIELTVRVDNVNAKALYERLGFKTEGLHRRAFFVDGEFFDVISMALLR
jgi:RimJ/RimL family protein N-acetyltransferase